MNLYIFVQHTLQHMNLQNTLELVFYGKVGLLTYISMVQYSMGTRVGTKVYMLATGGGLMRALITKIFG
jgi:hypothetical protein